MWGSMAQLANLYFNNVSKNSINKSECKFNSTVLYRFNCRWCKKILEVATTVTIKINYSLKDKNSKSTSTLLNCTF